MISIGTNSLKAARYDLNYAAHRLAKLGLIPSTRIKVKRRSLVATAELGHGVDVESLCRTIIQCDVRA